MPLLQTIGDPTLSIGLAFGAFATWFADAEFDEILGWSQTMVELADGDPTKGAGFGFGAPLAIAVAFRCVARWWLGLPGWRQDIDDAVAMARNSDPATLSVVVTWTYGLAIQYGVLRADDSALRTIEEALQTAHGASSDIALIFAEYSLGAALLYRDAAADRRRGLEIMARAREWQSRRMPSLVPITAMIAGRETARRGERDAAISVMRKAVDELYEDRPGYVVWAIGVLVETLLERGAEGDLGEAEVTTNRLATLRPDRDWAIRDIMLLQLRALLARARGEDAVHRDLAIRYRAMAEPLGFEGHIARAKKMAEAGQ
jgi:hypothetical protein